MEDLEKFNQIYKIQNSKCSLFGEFKQVINLNTLIYPDDSSKSFNYQNSKNSYEKSISIFRIELYLKRIIENMKKQKIKSLVP